MPSCVLKTCKNESTAMKKDSGITYHRFPRPGHEKREAWIKFVQKNRNEYTWVPSEHTLICSAHFKEEDKTYTKTGRLYLKKCAEPYDGGSNSRPETPCLEPVDPISEPDNVSPDEQDLSRVIEQCRFCGEFTKQCISVSNMLHCSEDRTTLVFNNLVVQIDFNDHTLPKTICTLCHKKLQEIHDFVTVVKNAQKSLVKLEVKEVDPLEMLIIKQEYEDSDDDNNEGNGCQLSNDEDNNIEGDKDIDDSSDTDNNHDDIENDRKLDSLIVSKTMFVKKTGAQKRKIHISENNSKKVRVTGSESDEYQENMIDIKEEVIENDNNDVSDTNNTDIGETGTDEKPSEVALAASSLVFQMRDSSDGFS